MIRGCPETGIPQDVFFVGIWFSKLPSSIYFIPECAARVPVSLWGSGGWGCVRSTLRNRSQPFATHTPHSTLHTPHSTLYTPHSTLHTLHSPLHTLHFILYTLHSTLHTLHFTLSTLHSTLLYTPHSMLHALHSTLYTLHSTLYTLHSTLYTSHSTLRTLHSTLYTPHATLFTLHSTLYTLDLHSTLHTLHSTLFTAHSTLSTAQLTLHTPHSTIPTSHYTYTFATQHSTFFTPHTLHSTLFRLPQSTVHWYGNRGKMYKTVEVACFTKVFYVTAFGFVGCILFFWIRQTRLHAAQVDVLKATIALIVTIAPRSKPCIAGPNCKLRHGWGVPRWQVNYTARKVPIDPWLFLICTFYVLCRLDCHAGTQQARQKTRRHYYERAVPVKRFWLWKNSNQPIQHGKAQRNRMQQSSQLVRWPGDCHSAWQPQGNQEGMTTALFSW